MEILCTICSKKKDDSNKPLPASKRYKGTRIATMVEMSKNKGLPLYFLSGKFGLIDSNTLIPYYDKLLIEQLVDNVVKKVTRQIHDNEINKVFFYAKPKTVSNRKPYYDAITKACEVTNTHLQIETLG